MRKSKLSTILLFFVFVFATSVAVFTVVRFVRPFSRLNQPLLIAKARTPKGTTTFLTQTYRGFSEGYDVHFLTHNKNGMWHQYYVGHEEPFWASGNLKLDIQNKTVSVWKGVRPQAHFNWRDGSYRLERDKLTQARPYFRLLQQSTSPLLSLKEID